MRYCNQCHRVTPGEPLFCNFCGCSYNAKLCPHRHVNPRNAEICSQCGSRDLSTPQPRTPFWLEPLVAILSAFPGILLLVTTALLLFGVIRAVLTNQQLLFQAIVAGLMLTFLWYLYTKLPRFLRRLISKLFKRSHRGDHGE